MTREDLDELENAVRATKDIADRLGRRRESLPLEDLAICALIRAVELLAKRFTEAGDATTKVSTALETPKNDEPCEARRKWRVDETVLSSDECPFCDGRESVREVRKPTVGPPGTFPDELVERLAGVAFDAGRDDVVAHGGLDRGRWEFLHKSAREHQKSEVRAVLSELVKTPVELPTPQEIRSAWIESPEEAPYKCRREDGVHKMLQTRIAPILAAKDAEIARQQGVIRLQNKTAEGCVSRGAHESQIAELEKKLAERDARIETIGKFPGVKEALQKVRGLIEKAANGHTAVPEDDCFRIIDGEVANLEENERAFVAHCRPDGSVTETTLLPPFSNSHTACLDCDGSGWKNGVIGHPVRLKS